MLTTIIILNLERREYGHNKKKGVLYLENRKLVKCLHILKSRGWRDSIVVRVLAVHAADPVLILAYGDQAQPGMITEHRA